MAQRRNDISSPQSTIVIKAVTPVLCRLNVTDLSASVILEYYGTTDIRLGHQLIPFSNPA